MNQADLLSALQSFRAITGCFSVDEMQKYSGKRYSKSSEECNIICYHCRDRGHRAVNCPKQTKQQDTTTLDRKQTVTCFSCGNKGHYSTECPSKTVAKKDEDSVKKQNRKEKPAKRVQVVEQTILQQEDDSGDLNIMIGRVGDKTYPFVLDSGARITVVPEEALHDTAIRNETIRIGDANGGVKTRRLADVLLTLGRRQLTQRVAIAPAESLDGKVLLSLDFTKDEDIAIIDEFRKNKREVRAVATRKTAEKEKNEDEELETARSGGKMLIPKDPEQFGSGIKGEEEDERVLIAEQNDASVDGRVIKEEEGSAEGEIPNLTLKEVKEDGSMDDLRKKTREDGSLEAWRSLADRKERGFSWRDGLLVKHELDDLSQSITLIVLPTKYRSQVLKLAHDHSGHYSWRKVLVIVRRLFVCPFNDNTYQIVLLVM